MAETIRINTLMKIYLQDYKKLKMAYYKKYWNEDAIYRTSYEKISKASESDLIISALNDCVCQLKYDEKINL